MFPGLYLLGTHERCTPGLAAEIALTSAALCSLEEARQMLANHGSLLNIKTIRDMVKRFAAHARVAQQSGDSEWVADQASVQGRRVVADVCVFARRSEDRRPAKGIADTKRIGVNPSFLSSISPTMRAAGKALLPFPGRHPGGTSCGSA